MTGETLYPRLEPLLAQIQKPIQYVGGELNAQVKPWDDAAVHWALMYPDAYEVGLPNQGLMILYEVLNERPDALAERTYAVWPDLAAPHARERRPAVHRRRAPRRRATSTCSASASPPSSATPTCSRRSTSPASRCTRSTATRRHPVVVAGGHAAFNPEPVADFVDCAVLGDGEQVVGDITDVVKAWKAQGRPGGRVELLARLARVDGVYVPALLRGLLRPRRRDRGGQPHPGRRPRAGRQAHRHGPRRVALPEDAAGAAGRERARADERRDLPRLHPRLPLLPGRDDHPPGARADDHRHRLDGRAGPQGDRLRGGRAALASPAPTTPRSASWPRSSPTATRAPTPASACRAPASTPSTSRWPTSCPATDGAPASPSPPRAAASGSAG